MIMAARNGHRFEMRIAPANPGAPTYNDARCTAEKRVVADPGDATVKIFHAPLHLVGALPSSNEPEGVA